MDEETLRGMIQTVLSPASPDQLGVTLCHEHCLVDLSGVFNLPSETTKKMIAHEPVSFENVYYLRFHPTENLDNLLLLDEELAISELSRFRNVGGQTVIVLNDITARSFLS